MAMFRGAVTSLANYVAGQVDFALSAVDEDRRYADRSVRHLLTHLPTRALLEQLLDVVVGWWSFASGRRDGPRRVRRGT
jgi:hypothetical protein